MNRRLLLTLVLIIGAGLSPSHLGAARWMGQVDAGRSLSPVGIHQALRSVEHAAQLSDGAYAVAVDGIHAYVGVGPRLLDNPPLGI